MRPLRNQKEDPGKHLRSRGQAEAQGTKLIDQALKKEQEIMARVLMSGDLEIQVLEVQRKKTSSPPSR